MGMVFHGVTHDVGHLVETAVVQLTHRVEDTSLHRLQSVLQRGNGTVQNHIRGIVEKPILEHTLKGNHMIFFVVIHKGKKRNAKIRFFSFCQKKKNKGSLPKTQNGYLSQNGHQCQ